MQTRQIRIQKLVDRLAESASPFRMCGVCRRHSSADRQCGYLAWFNARFGEWSDLSRLKIRQIPPTNGRGRKGSTFEGGVRVPFIIRWPGHVPSATVCNEWLGHLNILPTLASWCGLAKPRLPLDGFEASATLLHRDKAPAKPIVYFACNNSKNDVHCIRAGAWKMRIAQSDGEIYVNDHTAGRNNYMLPKPELYNLESDPRESYSVAKRYPEIVQQLHEDLQRELATFPLETQAAYGELQKRVASTVTPPGASPRFLTGPLPDWAWEPDDRR